MDFAKKSTTHKQKNKRENIQEFVEGDVFLAVESREKTTKIPSVVDDKFLEKSTVLPIKKKGTPKDITCEKTKKPPQKRNLTEEACDRKLSPVRKLSRNSDDNSPLIFNTPSNVIYVRMDFEVASMTD
ncbi:hypothetical protein TNCV_3072771 [Trichonephila clavipes]|nr:hypothetical protein TNCV_3072771 [Trichonephila clavipes]